MVSRISKEKAEKEIAKLEGFVPVDEEDIKHAIEIPVKERQVEKIERQGIIKEKKTKTRKPRTRRTKIEKKGKNLINKIINKDSRIIKVGNKKIELGKIRVKAIKTGGHILIITEKPQAAAKIADALGNARKYSDDGVPYYELERDGEKIVVAAAVGHLFTVNQKPGETGFPIFELEWIPSYLKKAEFSKKYYFTLLRLVKDAKEFIISTDYDIEGEVIGLNIVRFIAEQKDAARMKFSSLTKDELVKSYQTRSKSLDWGLAIAGETRHYLDWIYGINLSRALMAAIKAAGAFRIMSIGRVQGPALSLVVDKELTIKAFKPSPYWGVFVRVEDIWLKYIKDIVDKKELAKFEKLKGKLGTAETKTTEEHIMPPAPFDLTTLQTEAYKFYGINPGQTLKIAQQLYLSGIISYPRTSSQKIPEAINARNILKKLRGYEKLVNLATRNKPVEGSKSDPAHPSIYPTGEQGKLTGEQEKIYDLIVRRFISCFCQDALVKNKKISFVVDTSKSSDFDSHQKSSISENLLFIAKGLEIEKKGWIEVYKTKLKESELKTLAGKLEVEQVKIDEKMTQPPNRYTPASLVRELEKRNLGTKCLAGETKIIFNGQLVSIEEAFYNGKNHHKEKDTEIREINNKTLSLDKEGNIIHVNSNLISRRKVRENEKIVRVETDSASIKLTGDHLVYILRDNKIKQIFAKELSISDSLVGIIKKFHEGEALIEEKAFDKRFLKTNGELKHKFSAKKNKGIMISNLPIKWSSSFAWILGYFYGDGSYSDPKYNGSHQIYFTTTEKKALELLKRNVKQIFGNEPYAYDLGGKYKVNLNCVMSYAIVSSLPEIKEKKPVKIPKEFIGDFLRGFFDADGNVHLRPLGKTKIKGVVCNSFDTPRIKLTLGNKELIEWVSILLKEIGIDNNISKSYALCKGKRFNCWTIRISNRERVEKFAYEVGSETYKEDILYKGLKCASKNYKILRNCAKIVLLLSKKPMKIEDIINETTLSRYESLYALLRLFRMDVINKKRFSQAKRYIYSLKDTNSSYLNYCMKLVYEKVSKDLYKIPIKKIENSSYNGYVYDLSVNKKSPNFVIEGNILVHNSTRASIIDTLYNRGYVRGQSIEATELGISLIKTLKKHAEIIIDEKLTRNFEKEIEAIQASKKGLKEKEEKVLKEAKEAIIKIAEKFKKEDKEIGKELLEANGKAVEAMKKENELMTCPVCKKGKLVINYSKKTRRNFVACNAYPECKTTFSLPPNGSIRKTDKVCEKCGFPMLIRLSKGRRPWIFCFNPECETNKEWADKRKK